MTRLGVIRHALLVAAIVACASDSRAQAPDGLAAARDALGRYCQSCHSATAATAGVVVDPDRLDSVADDAELWERVVRQLRTRAMPPAGPPRPDAATYEGTAAFLESALDRAASARPNPGRLPRLGRLTRTEYQNAIRDLLALEDLPAELDYTLLLPADNASSGFDNIADLLFVDPVTMERYLDAARKISRLAVGDPEMPVMVNIHPLSLQMSQDERVDELSFGTRGGLAFHSYFPLDAEYVVDVELTAATPEDETLEISLDGEQAQLVTVSAGAGRGGIGQPGPRYRLRIPVGAGPHLVGVTFVRKNAALDETVVRPRMRDRGTKPSLAGVTLRGPYNAAGAGDTPSRRRIFVCRPENANDEPACAAQILSTLVRRAYRRPATEADLARLMPFYEAGRSERNFEYGIQQALERLLVSPQFLYRIERDPPGTAPGTAYRVSDLELASRVAFFLWSSIPDDELLDLAVAGRLSDANVLRGQVDRMLEDPRSKSLVTNFAAQWLSLRGLEDADPDLFLFRDFDISLERALERETELFLESVLLEDRSVLDLVRADYTFLNERLAEHYDIPNVEGSYFRRVQFPENSPRGGLLGQGSILALTSYSTRTSPVLRGKYVLENLLASPPPPPPPNVPALETGDRSTDRPPSMREAMEAHRAAPACAGCHARMDPIGFALENFDAVGRWRDSEGGRPIDTSGVLPDGTEFSGVDGLRRILLEDPERFARALTEKLLMYAVGRNVQYYDAPAVREVLRDAAATEYTFRSLIEGIVESVPFQMRQAQ